MENGVVMETEEGPPQGGNLSPLLARRETETNGEQREKPDCECAGNPKF